MTKPTTFLLILLVAFVAAGCRGMRMSVPPPGQPIVSQVTPAVSTPESQQPAFRQQSANHAVIGHLTTRDKVITILTGPLYTVKTADGKVLAEQLQERELYSKFPELEEVLERSLAGNDARLVPSDRKRTLRTDLQQTPE